MINPVPRSFKLVASVLLSTLLIGAAILFISRIYKPTTIEKPCLRTPGLIADPCSTDYQEAEHREKVEDFTKELK